MEVWAAALPHQAGQEGYHRVPQRSPEDILLGCGSFGLQDLLTKAQVRLFHALHILPFSFTSLICFTLVGLLQRQWILLWGS